MTRLLVAQIVFLCLLFYYLTAVAAEREYMASLSDTQWVSGGQKQYECTLTQDIPFYGQGTFVRKSGHNVSFDLYSDDMVLNDSARVVLQSKPPAWRHDDKVFEIGQFDFEAGHNPLKVKSPFASRMLQQIENGMSPVITYRDLADGRDIITVMLSPINFRKALKDYRECENSLLDFDIDEIKNLKIYFDSNKYELTKRSMRDLKNVIRYLKIDPKILQIKLTAHSDSRGRRRANDRLAEQRNESVANFLIKQGVKKEMLFPVSHGERDAQFSNKTALGRAKNRRVDVELLTTEPPTAEEQEAMKQARKEERRRQLTERSIFKDLPKRRSQPKKKSSAAEAEDELTDSDEQVDADDQAAADEQESQTDDFYDNEPPTPNFINFDHLVDKNNQSIQAE